jgi:Tol biopolymer transport system component
MDNGAVGSGGADVAGGAGAGEAGGAGGGLAGSGGAGVAGNGAAGVTGGDDDTAADGGCPECVCRFGDFSAPVLVTGLGLSADVFGPSISPDGRLLALSHFGGSSEKLAVAARSGETTFLPASDAAQVALINTDASEGTPFLGLDGLSIYFYSSRGEVGDRDLYSASRSDFTSAFDDTQLVPGVNSTAADLLPWVSLDARTIYFTSRRTAARGGANLWRATRTDAASAFDAPALVDELCSDGADEKPALTLDQRYIVFMSDRAGSLGDDLWTASRSDTDGPFDAPVRLANLNTSEDEREPALSIDGRELFFTSNLDGVRVIHRATREYVCELSDAAP